MPDKKLLIGLGVAVLILFTSIIFSTSEEEDAVPEDVRREMEEAREDVEEGETEETDMEAVGSFDDLGEDFQDRFYEVVNVYLDLESVFMALDDEEREDFEVTYNYVTDKLDEIEEDVVDGEVSEEEGKALLEELERDINDLKEEIETYND